MGGWVVDLLCEVGVGFQGAWGGNVVAGDRLVCLCLNGWVGGWVGGWDE